MGCTQGSVRTIRYACWLTAVALCGGCGDDTPERDANAADRGHDAGDRVDAATAPRRFATATAEVRPLAQVPDGIPAVNGRATFSGAEAGISLTLSFLGCAERPFSLTISNAPSCAEATASSPPWPAGEGIPSPQCSGGATGAGQLSYLRPDDAILPWSIGGPEGSDLVGRTLLFLAPDSREPIACGVIERTADIEWAPLPPPDAPPSTEVRAQIAGFCLGSSFTGLDNAGCLDAESALACSSAHCNVGSCLRTCADYAACLDGRDDPCGSALSCPETPECIACQADLFMCTLAHCVQEFTCASSVTPGGPCSQLAACCALQGAMSDGCYDYVRLLETWGGDANCLGVSYDWDALWHTRVPCPFED